MAVICGMPAPVTTRVVQIEPGPMPTLMASAPARASSQAPSKVPTLPAMQVDFRQLRLHQLDGIEHASGVAVSAVNGQHIHLHFTISCARSRKSPVAPMAAPTRSRPCESLAALGYFSFF